MRHRSRRRYGAILVGSSVALVVGAGVALAAQGDTTRVSVASNGTQANSNSVRSALSAEGRYIAFDSFASNLVAGDSNGFGDVFVHDRQTGNTTRVSVASNGAQGNGSSSSPAISANGRYVTFESNASNLVAGDSNGFEDVFVHDRQTGTTTRVSVASNGSQATGPSSEPAMSTSGRYISFLSFAPDMVTGDTNLRSDVFVHDRQTGNTTRVSVDSAGVQGNNHSQISAISADGRYVAFQSQASNLVAGDTNAVHDVFVHDRQNGNTIQASVSSNATQGNGTSIDPAISTNGRYITFRSNASNLVLGDSNGFIDVFVHDQQTGNTTRVSVSSSATQGNSNSLEPAISADGRFTAFSSNASNLVPGDSNGFVDVFVHDRQTGDTNRVSLSSIGTQSNAHAAFPVISGDGRYVGFSTAASTLDPSDSNGLSDVFVHQRLPDLPLPNLSEGVGVVDQTTGVWTLLRPNGQVSSFFYGNPGDVPFMGDWDCDGIDTPGLYRQSDGFVYLRNSNSQGIADVRFFFGNPGDLPLAGDFDGDGCDTVSIYRSSEARWYVINELGANDGGLGAADFSYLFGDHGDVPFVGDWNNDGIDTPGLRRFSNGFVYIRNTNTQGVADQSWFYGDDGDHVFTGDYDGDGVDSIGLFRPSNTTIYLRNSLSTGIAETQFQIGTPNSKPVAGKMN